ncbi:MAG: permease [Bdellovibrionaceae bacterium]|nr:permease [Pseudobdellovibrionaceae bacterium]
MLGLGYLAAVLMGGVLGLIGGGGSILTVPILVYLMSVSPVEATAYSLFVVGTASLIGSVDYIRRDLVRFKVGLVFSVPAFVGVYGMRRFVLPAIPDTIRMTSFEVSKDGLILTAFSVMMVLASYFMIRGRKNQNADQNIKLNIPLIGLEGFVVGSISGFVGAGGGFLIIPSLVLLAGLEMKAAVGTSLMIIAVNSLIGFIGDLQVMESIQWAMLLRFVVCAVVGIFVGIGLSRRVPGAKLKPLFGWFVLVVGSAIFLQQMFA